MLFVILGICILFKDAFPFMWARFVTHEVVVGIMDRTTRRITPNKDFKKKNGVFYYKGEALPYIKVYPGNYLFCGLPFDILDVDLQVITDPRYRKACSDLRKAGYPNINSLEKAIWFSQIGDPNDLRMKEMIAREGYADYEEARVAINPKNLTVEHPIVKQFFTSIQLGELVGYGSCVPSDNILGEVDDVYEARKPDMKFKREIEKMIPTVLLIFGMAAAVVIIYIVFFKAKTG